MKEWLALLGNVVKSFVRPPSTPFGKSEKTTLHASPEKAEGRDGDRSTMKVVADLMLPPF
ncbi:hypothetical protein [Hoeflea poritis]|uniref:Uncharacterized protein n=1 Tax=Hoeflea poritis TaxID=2993659 RepID=A0ABT4VMD0_9HYPH|nr:hypothetical protein [Hoeflea poritis]MDA4845869.1 hypothetical protein [Hoeflea poritis]